MTKFYSNDEQRSAVQIQKTRPSDRSVAFKYTTGRYMVVFRLRGSSRLVQLGFRVEMSSNRRLLHTKWGLARLRDPTAWQGSAFNSLRTYVTGDATITSCLVVLSSFLFLYVTEPRTGPISLLLLHCCCCTAAVAGVKTAAHTHERTYSYCYAALRMRDETRVVPGMIV